MKVLYASSSLPFGTGEVFIAPEVEELRRLGHALRLAPVRPGRDVPHRDALPLRSITRCVRHSLACPSSWEQFVMRSTHLEPRSAWPVSSWAEGGCAYG